MVEASGFGKETVRVSIPEQQTLNIFLKPEKGPVPPSPPPPPPPSDNVLWLDEKSPSREEKQPEEHIKEKERMKRAKI